MLFAAAVATIRNKNEVVLFNRTITKEITRKATAVIGTSFAIFFLSTVLLSAFTNAPGLDVIYETASATATVGLTRNLTSFVNVWGKIILIFTMYLGRIGPISLAFAFLSKNESQNNIKDPVENISVG